VIRLSAAVLVLALPAAGWSQTASIAVDWNVEAASPSDSNPEILGTAGRFVLFRAQAPTLGSELWSTDGTFEGTTLIRDFTPGPEDGYPRPIGTASGRFLFTARTGVYGGPAAVFATDGTVSGTESLIEIDSGYSIQNIGETRSAISDPLARIVFLLPNESGEAADLISSDGTAAGTTVLSTVPGGSVPPIRVADRYVFLAFPAQGDAMEVWSTDGTSQGTSLLASIPDFGYPTLHETDGARGFLSILRGERTSLWATDGTPAGTMLLVDFPGARSRIGPIAARGSRAYFAVDDSSTGAEIWTSNGTPSGTVQVTDFGPQNPFPDYTSNADFLAILDDGAVFSANDGIDGLGAWFAGTSPGSSRRLPDGCPSGGCGYIPVRRVGQVALFFGFSEVPQRAALWVTDGSVNGTFLLTDGCPGSCLDLGGGAFVASSPSHALIRMQTYEFDELWVSDGTAPGTIRLTSETTHSPLPAEAGSRGNLVTDDRAFFAAADPLKGRRLWASTREFESPEFLGPVTASWSADSNPAALIARSSELFWDGAADGQSARLLRTSTETGATEVVPGILTTCDYGYAARAVVQDRLVFSACYAEPPGLWVIPAGSESAEPLFDLDQYLRSSLVLGDTLYLFTEEWPYIPHVWTSDGTSAGTALRLSYEQNSDVEVAGILNGRILISVNDSGVRALHALSPDLVETALTLPEDGMVSRVRIASDLAFFTRFRLGLPELWRTDGTIAGTFRLGSSPHSWIDAAVKTESGYQLLFPFSPLNLWVSDGTPEGTRFVMEIPGSTHNYVGSPAIAIGSRAVFATTRAVGGVDYWRSDGTAEGLEWIAGIPNSSPAAMRPVLQRIGSVAVLEGYDAEHGVELRLLSSESAAPRILHDIFPGPESSDAGELVQAGDSLYFPANDGVHGRELWKFRLADALPCTGSPRSLCLEGGRFRVEAVWRGFETGGGDATAVPVTGDTGYFWFFEQANVELILKVLDGIGYNGHHWVFYGALSNVDYAFTVTDTQTGATRRYFNPAGRFASAGDITAFGPLGAHAVGEVISSWTSPGAAPAATAAASRGFGVATECSPSPVRFCVLNNRFAVEATWRDFYGNTGTANAASLTDDTGYLWFFDEANVEVVLKAVDGGGYNGHFWIYFGALSNVEYTITVTDTATGDARVYTNALGNFASFGDIEAFPAP
jgi:ELWxxDGT repeat protein